VICLTCVAGAQPLKVAIIDFDNISGIAKYDGLGKAMSSMLISDIESNVSAKRFQLVERAQINKILKEQNLQKTASFDKNTAVRLGKLLGVVYLLIGDVYVLDNTLIINARLTDVSTGDIKFSEKQEGKINEWLTIKTKLGKAIAASMSMPFTEPRTPDAIISPAVLTTYANAIDENDKGNFDKAETLINTAREFSPDFKYLDDLRDDLEKLKKKVAEQGKKIEVLEMGGGLIVNPLQLEDYKFNLAHSRINEKDRHAIVEEIFAKFANQLSSSDFNYLSRHGIYIKNYFIVPQSREDFEKIKTQLLFHKSILLDPKMPVSIKKYYVLQNDLLVMRNMNFVFNRQGENYDTSIIRYIGESKSQIIENIGYLRKVSLLSEGEYFQLLSYALIREHEAIKKAIETAEIRTKINSLKEEVNNLQTTSVFYGQTKNAKEREISRLDLKLNINLMRGGAFSSTIISNINSWICGHVKPTAGHEFNSDILEESILFQISIHCQNPSLSNGDLKITSLEFDKHVSRLFEGKGIYF